MGTKGPLRKVLMADMIAGRNSIAYCQHEKSGEDCTSATRFKVFASNESSVCAFLERVLNESSICGSLEDVLEDVLEADENGWSTTRFKGFAWNESSVSGLLEDVRNEASVCGSLEADENCCSTNRFKGFAWNESSFSGLLEDVRNESSVWGSLEEALEAVAVLNEDSFRGRGSFMNWKFFEGLDPPCLVLESYFVPRG